MGDGLIVCVPGIQDTFLGKTDLFELDPLKQMYSCACASKYICNYILQKRHVKSLGQSQSDANKNKLYKPEGRKNTRNNLGGTSI